MGSPVLRLPRLLVAVALMGTGFPTPSSAQVVPRPTGPLVAPPVPFSDPGDALGVEVSPATLALEDTWHLRVLHVDAPSEVAGAARGDAVLGAVKLPFGLALGAGISSIRPTGGDAARGRGSIALAWAPSQAIALGGALRIIRSDDPTIGDLTSLDLSTAWRPSPALAVTFDVQDVTGPAGLTGLAGGELPATFRLAVGLRPFGTDALVVDLAGAVDTQGAVGARAALDIGLPRVGRLRAAAEATGLDGGDPALAILAGLAIDWGGLRVEGGAILGDVRQTGATGWYASAALSGRPHRGLPTGRHLVDLPLRGTLDARRLPAAIAYLDALADAPDVAGVLLRLRGTGLGVAAGEELAEALEELRRNDVAVVCHLEAPTGAEWLACLGADAIVLDPAGGIRLTGPSTTVFLLGELLDRVGVRAEFLRIGAYKSAPEQYENRRPSDPAMEAREAFVSDVRGDIGARIGDGLELDAARAEAVIDDGPYTATEARRGGLVRELADEREIGPALVEILGRGFRRRPATALRPPDTWSRPTKVGVVVVDGQIVDGRNVDIPILDIHLTGGDTIVDTIDRLAGDPAVAAIVLRVDSPGGSALASDRIWRAVRRARRRKPVVASLGGIAASGGYYVASAADVVFADATTLTGSIGIFYGKVDVAGLADRLGVATATVQGGARAGYDGLFRPFTADERRMIAGKIREFYRLFLQRVAEGRGLREDEVDAVARGRIWSGRAARSHGLVDELGGFGAALREARRRAGLEGRRDVGIAIAPSRPRELLDYVIGDLGALAEHAGDTVPGAADGPQPGALLRAADPILGHLVERAIGLAHVTPDTPMALLSEVRTGAHLR